MKISQNSALLPSESPRKRRNVRRKLALSVFVMLVVGVLAFFIPQILSESGTGDTTDAWLEGFTAMCCGIPLMILGAGVSVITCNTTAVRHVRSV
jgi:H+/Cl- antiporter ClcA